MKTLLTIGLVCSATLASTCCAVVSVDDTVVFGSQANIVIWDSRNQTEHFVRRANFESEADDLGFIAPTPSVPEIYEVDEAVFLTLDSMKPKQPVATKSASEFRRKGVAPGGFLGVEVIQKKNVAGYLATTLKATDSESLADWMSENDYATTPAIEKWTQFYIDKDWYLTAYKVVADEEGRSTGTVRMTFKTEKPFNPYLVPADNRGGTGGLRLFYLGQGNPTGKIGGEEGWVNKEWSVKVPDQKRTGIARQLAMDESEIPSGMILTSFRDLSFPNDAQDDLYFTETWAGFFGIGMVPSIIGSVVFAVAAFFGGMAWSKRRARKVKDNV